MAKSGMFSPLPGSGGQAASRRPGEWRPLWPVPRDAPPAPDAHPTLGKPAAVYTYCTASGELAGYVLRFEPPSGGKEIRPLTYCEHTVTKAREWRWKSFAPFRPLYGLDRLAQRPDAPVVVTEGEGCADAAGALLPGYVAVTSSGGSKAAGKADWGALRGRRVVIWRDADEAGSGYAVDVAQRLALVGADVAIVTPPEGAPDGWDAANATAEGWDHAKALALVAAATPASEAMRGGHGADGGTAADAGGDSRTNKGSGGPKGPPQRDRIIDALGESELWHTPDSKAFASAPVNGHIEHWAVRSREFRVWLARCFYAASGGAIGGQALEDALRVIEAKAVHEGLCHEPWRRVGEHDGAIYLDLGDADRRAVKITIEGWDVVARAPIKFLRSRAMRPLPEPEAGEPIEHLRGFVNVESDDDFLLMVAWLVAVLRPRGPYPIGIINGEHGSAKSTCARVLCALVDPNVAPTRSEPKDERDLFVAAHNNRVLSFDNLSGLPGWLSDALCRLSTGGGFATRELHSDRNEVVLVATGPVILNGIADLGARADLGDRALTFTLPAIGDDARQTEAEFWAAFEAHRPSILGALCDGVSCALRRQGEVKLDRKLRMADFIEWVEAAAPALGVEPGAFSRAYAENRAATVRMAIENNPVAQAVRSLAREIGHWEGSASELIPILDGREAEATKKHRSWPSTPSTLGRALMRMAPDLRGVGVDVQRDFRGKNRDRVWVIEHKGE